MATKQEAEAEKLQREMQSLTLKSTLSKCREDMRSMSQWSAAFQADANRQGFLDIKFLQNRYNRGLEEVDKFCDLKHTYVNLTEYGPASAEILRRAAAMQSGGGHPRLCGKEFWAAFAC